MNAQPFFDDFHRSVYEDRLANLIAEQGPKLGINSPADFGKDIWPEEDNIDDFLAWLDKTRREEAGYQAP